VCICVCVCARVCVLRTVHSCVCGVVHCAWGYRQCEFQTHAGSRWRYETCVCARGVCVCVCVERVCVRVECVRVCACVACVCACGVCGVSVRVERVCMRRVE